MGVNKEDKEEENSKINQNPRENANFFSKLFFLWIIPLFKIGFRKDLVKDDMYQVLTEDSSTKLGEDLEKAWEHEVMKAKEKNSTPRLGKALFSVHGKFYLCMGLVICIDECVFRVAQPILLRLFIKSFTDSSTINTQYLYASFLCFAAFLHVVGHHTGSFSIYHTGMKCRSAVSALIYRKALRLSKAAQSKTTVGQLTNLLANDVNRFDFNLLFFPYLIGGPIQLLIFIYILWTEVGVASLGGIGFVILLSPVQYYIGKYSARFRRKVADKTDDRVRSMNEIVMAMRVIKMYAWEKPFAALIDQLRRLEVKALKNRAYLRAAYQAFFNFSGKLTLFLTVLIFVLNGNNLSADKVFFAYAIFTVVMQNMVYVIPAAAAGLGELWVALRRVEEFLLLEEQSSSGGSLQIFAPLDNELNKEMEASVKMENITASWSTDKPTLKSINVNLSNDSLIMIVGAVGSGKSSFLNLLLSELPIDEGQCTIHGTSSYASQEPWIFPGTLRDNILFGLPFDEERYKEIIHACALKDDLKQLPFGDFTLLSDGSGGLSGGQKARVNLARALYREADIYLLDDPLSAVDAKVSRHIFEKCVKTYLRGRLRILVTHQLQYLSGADHIIVLNEGKVVAQGSYETLVDQNLDLFDLISSEENEEAIRKASILSLKKAGQEEAFQKQLETQEAMSVGSVTLSTYKKYFKSGESCCGAIVIIAGFVTAQLATTLSDFWLSFWTNQSRHLALQASLNDTGPDFLPDPSASTFITTFDTEESYLAVYSVLVAFVVVLVSLTSFLFFRFCMTVGINLHNRMFNNLVRAPIAFFDENPAGRIMNRFTKDIGSMDELLPPAFYDMNALFLQMFGQIVVVVLANYYSIIPTIFVVILLYLVRLVYIRTVRGVKRLESISKSPVFSHMCTSFNGLSIIRASKSQNLVISQFDQFQDSHSSTWYLFLATTRAFGIWLELVCVIYLTLISFSFLIISTSTLSGSIGLALSSCLGMVGIFQFAMRQSAETENLMISVERILEYIGIRPEAPLESSPGKKPPRGWPQKGTISFKSLYLSYGEKDVLKDLTFDIEHREKIGIVGRTGAGKSTVITSLLRMTEPREGDIFIDGVRINDIGLHDLRTNISIIPQDPVLFSGSVRYNLDPFGHYGDDELWKVLEEVELKEAIPSLDIIEDFSVGQRQLICLARAILRNNKIIVLDEATANVDPKTDSFIQQTIRVKFADCCIITIAHRLHTVMDCDKILVLESGSVKEYDHPHILLQNETSALSSLVAHTGKASSEYLRKVAEESYNCIKQFKTRL